MATVERNAPTDDLRTSKNQAKGQREGESKNGDRGDLSNGVPKPPGQLWYRSIKMLKPWNRHKAQARTVATSTRVQRQRQESARTPTSLQPQRGDMATTGAEVNIELSNVDRVGNNSGNGSAPIESGRLTPGSSTAVKSGGPSSLMPPGTNMEDHPEPGAEHPPLVRYIDLTQERENEASQSHDVYYMVGVEPEDLVAPEDPYVVRLAQANPVLASPPDTVKDPKKDTVADAVVPTMKIVPDKQVVKDGSGEANRLVIAWKEQYALRHVYMSLEHCMKDYERMLAGLRIDMEDHKGCRRISVTCFAGAVEKAKEIESILCKAGGGLQGFKFVVRRNEGMTIFGFKGPSDGAAYFGGTQIHHHHHNTSDRRQGRGDQAFSDTPYWKPGSVLVEIFCAARPHGNIAGAPLRIEVERRDGSSITCSWTCGGIVKIDGVNYGLTTAHPLVLSDSVPTPPSIQSKKPMRDTESFVDLLARDEESESTSGFFSMETNPEYYWQAFGKVSHYALARIGSLPYNNDWLLFELPKDRVVWSDFATSENPDQNDLAVFTARIIVAASLREGTAFLILGNSPFEVLKIALEEPLRSGDSGSWVMRGDKLFGVMIGGSEENPDSPIGYAISTDDICRNISQSMGNASVRLLTSLENKILAQTATQHANQLEHLVGLRVRQLFSPDEFVGSIVTPRSHQPDVPADSKMGNAALSAFLKLGTICLSLLLRHQIEKKYRSTVTLYRSRTERDGRSLCREILQYKEGERVVHLIVALSVAIRKPKRIRVSRTARMLFIIMTELRMSPLPAPNCMQAVVEFVLGRYRWTSPTSQPFQPSTTREQLWFARSLGRILYTLQTSHFFFHTGTSAETLGTFLNICTDYPVIVFDVVDGRPFHIDNFVLSRSLWGLGIVPRIFVARDARYRVGSRLHPHHGDVVAYDELNELLESKKEEGSIRSYEDPFSEGISPYRPGLQLWKLQIRLPSK